MITLKIEPIRTITAGGHRVLIDGIRPTVPDCIVGKLANGPGPAVCMFWSLKGVALEGDHASKLDMGSDELESLRELALLMGVKR